MIAFRKARESIVVCAQQFNESKKCVGLPDFICAEVVLAFDAQKIPVKFYPVEFDTSGALQLNVGLIPFDEIRCCVVVNYSYAMRNKLRNFETFTSWTLLILL